MRLSTSTCYQFIRNAQKVVQQGRSEWPEAYSMVLRILTRTRWRFFSILLGG